MELRKLSLSANQLKILAMVSMLFDHTARGLGIYFDLFTTIGRLAFPIFAYMIAEGCRYTKNRTRYLCGILLLGVGCQAVYFIAMGSLYMSILMTFSLAITVIYATDWYIKKPNVISGGVALLTLAVAVYLTVILPRAVEGDFEFDYGIYGVLLPLFVFISPNKPTRLLAAAAVLFALSLESGGNQWYSLLALIPLALYGGHRGKYKLKYMFYIFYPLHLAVIYLISILN